MRDLTPLCRDDQVGRMVWAFPPLLSLSIRNNIKLKLRYLFRYMKVDKAVIVAQPQLLAYRSVRVCARERLCSPPLARCWRR